MVHTRWFNAALALSVGIAAIALYSRTLVGLASEWMSSPDASYGVLLAGVAGVVAWQRRGRFAQVVDGRAAPIGGAALLLCGAVLYVVGMLGADVFLARLSSITVLAGTIWFLAGPASLRVMAPPLTFLLIAIPLPTLILNAVTLPLQFGASRIAEVALSVIGVPVFRDGNVLELPSTALEVADACSGLRSIVSLAAVGAVLAWAAAETSGWRRAAIVAATTPVAIVMNGLRIAATAIACETWGPQAASGGWHTFTGWVTFVASVFVLVQVQAALARTRARGAPWSPRVVNA
jgi:exosortase